MKRVFPGIFGLSGLYLTKEEKRFFGQFHPYGFILFSRNCRTIDQIKSLIQEVKGIQGTDRVNIFIDQEGGRVVRLPKKTWNHIKPQKFFGDIALNDLNLAKKQAYEYAFNIGLSIKELGITHNCSPVLDVSQSYTTKAIGDRAFSNDPHIVYELGKTYGNGFFDAGIKPVMKHIPGHGRTRLDSHFDLPTVIDNQKILRENDFYPFKQLNDFPYAMTSHIIYKDIDPNYPATQSSLVIDKIIRQYIGFKGKIISDDLSMEALSGTIGDRAQQALKAGCDLILHCNGNIDEMHDIVGQFSY